MALYYAAGFDSSETPMAVVIAGPGAGTATIAAGTYCFTALNGTLGTGLYTSFATELDARLDGVVAGFTTTWNSTTYAWTISHASTFSLTWTGTAGLNLRAALGFTANLSGANTYTSTVRPYYVVVPGISARSEFTDVYEPDDIVEESVADGGASFSVDKDTDELFSDWVQVAETKAATLRRSASASVPWTWQHLYEHCRGEHPIAVTDGSTTTAHKLRADGAAFSSRVRERMMADYDDLWRLRFLTRDLGTV